MATKKASKNKSSKKKASRINIPPTKGRNRKFPPAQPELTDNLHSIEIYLRYTKLRSEAWIKILDLFEQIKTDVIKDYDLDVELSRWSNVNFPVIPTLDISIIRTGNSVIIRFEEGWKPTIKISEKEITIGLPKKVALPGLILYALFLGYDTYLDTQIKRLDLQMKKAELEEKLEKTKVVLRPQTAVDSAKQFINYILTDEQMIFVRVNNFVIKK